MSESDSFIHEVSEEVRRDRLFKMFKKYAWVLALVVIAIVGGTAYNEWNKSAREAEARLTGDLMSAAIAANDPGALQSLAAEQSASKFVLQLQQANLLIEAGDTAAALEALRAIANDAEAAPVYADLAWLKIVMLDGPNMPASEREITFDRLTTATAPYRLLAQEQRAMQYVRDGNIEAAINDLLAILGDTSAPTGLRNRAQQLIVALGGDIEQAVSNG